MSTFAGLQTDIDNLDATSDGLVSLATLDTVLNTVKALLLQLGIKECADLTALQATSGTEASTCLVAGKGFYTYSSSTGLIPAFGGGSWQRRTTGVTVADVADMAIVSPVDAQVLRYNSSTGKWENGNQAVANISFANVTGKPATLAGYGITDAILQKFVSSIGTASSGAGNIRLTPQGSSLTGGTNSTVAASGNILYMTDAFDSIIFTNRTTLRSGTTPFTVTRCIIIGDPGPLDAYFVSNALTDLTIIGSNGQPTYVKTANGTVTLAGADGGTPNLNVPMDVSVSNLNVTGDVHVVHDLTAASGSFNTTTATQMYGSTGKGAVVFAGGWTTAFRPPTPPSGEVWFGYNATTHGFEFNDGGGWTAF